MGDVWQGTKQVVSNVVNWVSNKVNQVANWASNTWQGVQTWAGNTFGGGNYNPYNPSGGYGSYPVLGGYQTSYGYVSAAQQQAIQTAQRQQRITNDYSSVTGNKGLPKTKEGLALFKNWNNSLKETIRKFCTTSDKVTLQKSGVLALSPGTTWKLPELKLPSLPKGAKVAGKVLGKVAGKAFWIITVVDLSNKAVNYIEHGDTNDLVVGGDITPKDVADAKVKNLTDKYPQSEEQTKGPTTQHEGKGNYDDALKDFDDLKLRDVKEIDTQYGKGKVGTLEDGRNVVVRPGSSSKNSDPTLEIQGENKSPDRTKIRYEKE